MTIPKSVTISIVSVAAWSLHSEMSAPPQPGPSLHDLLPLSLLLLVLVAAATWLVGRKLAACRSEAEKFRLFLSQASDGIGILNERGQAIEAGLDLVVCITEGVPVQDTARFVNHAVDAGVRLIGPNCPGIISPGKSNAGIIPANITGAGPIGLVSKSGTLTYQMMYELRDIGFSTAIGIGGDPIVGTTHIDALKAFEADPETQAIALIGEIGGDAEERAAEYIADNVTKPVVAYVAGFTAPEGRTMGHAGAIVSGSSGTAQAKKAAFEAVGVTVGRTPSETAELMRRILRGK